MKRAEAADLNVTLTQGFAYHYVKSKNYNDSVFRDNRTSTNTLLTLSYKGLDTTLLSDSQGDFSVALTGHRRLNKSLRLIYGAYILRDDRHKLDALPQIKATGRAWTATPLIGIEHTLALTDTLNFSTLVTPAFTLMGIQWKI